MVTRDRQHHAPAHRDLVPVGDGHATDGADREDGTLGGIDDGRELGDVEHAEIRDRERCARQLMSLQLPRARSLGQITRLHADLTQGLGVEDRKSTRLNSSHDQISYAVFCLKKKKNKELISLMLL